VSGIVERRIPSALIVYGTVLEAGSNRFAAEQLQSQMLHNFESEVPVRKDFEVSDQELNTHDVIFIGRPETNSALAAWKGRLKLDSAGAEFRVKGTAYAGGGETLVLAVPNPADAAHAVVVIAGNSALETVRVALSSPLGDAEYAIWREGKQVDSGFLH
jgi:hypothetical protein